ncbi:MAG TPA: PD-(D/E)XK nuclease family protein [Sedimentisphaerales bacterium]|nr:PD-(D/E)XK nuclease family protein [Sedimentisphaerales bacterium]
MAVQFILGRSGAGKTRCCIDSVISALLEPGEQPLVLLVPEQATYQAERAILTDTRVTGYHRLNVLSFDRLQFLLSGRKTARPALTRLGRQMIVHKLLRDNSRRFKVFGASAVSTGLARQMAETICELHEYAKTPQDLERLLSDLRKDDPDSLAALKFADISLVFAEYLKVIEDRFTDPDLQLSQACRAVAHAGLLRGARLWVDGFAGFTAAELAILAELLKTAADTKIALCLDPSTLNLNNPDAEKPDSFGLFGPTEQTYTELFEIVRKCKLKLAEPIILSTPVRFSASPPLAHLEAALFTIGGEKIPAQDKIRIVSAPNARAEVIFVARQVLEVVKEKGCRYRDIAVIASDIGRYQHYIKAHFDDYGIPFFIDMRKPLSQYPLVELICSALQTVIGGFSHHDILASLKTDLVPVPRSDVDLLENYCLAFGIAGADWQSDKDWDFEGEQGDFDEQRVNDIRRKVATPLLRLRERLYPPDGPAELCPSEFTQAVFDFMESLQVRSTIYNWINQAHQRAQPQNVDEHRQFYDKLVAVFDELVEVFGDRRLTAEDYLAILSSAFSQLTLAFIPPTQDQVLIGSIERSRHPDLKAVFLIGATQRQFPSPVDSPGILTDSDRSAAESADFAMAATSRCRLFERQYLAYIAFTRPSEFLCVTYPTTDEKGSPECRSQFVASLESLFEGLEEQSTVQWKVSMDELHSKTELGDLLCRELGRDTDRAGSESSRDDLAGLPDELAADEQTAQIGRTVLSALDYDNRAQLDADVVERLFGPHLNSSATRLGAFAACPYQHFARYILELAERKEFKFEPLDLGVFYHRVLDALLTELNAAQKDFAAIQDEQLLEVLRAQITRLVQGDAFISNFTRHSAHNVFIIDSAADVLEDCVLAIARMVRAGTFSPSRSEVAFGAVRDARDNLGSYEIALARNRLLFLDGKIDRIDVADIGDAKVALVFDYKRRPRTFSWSHLYHGLDMQLAIYMLAVRNTPAGYEQVAGAFYMPVEVSPDKGTLEKLSSETEGFAHKARGIFNGEFAEQLDRQASRESIFYNFYGTKDGRPYGSYATRGALRPADFEKVLTFTARKMVALARDILSGKIDVNPYRLNTQSPCGYCVYRPVCRFDWQINDYNILQPVNKTQILENGGHSQ